MIERALAFCCADDQLAIAAELLGSRDCVQLLAENQFGCYVLRELLKLDNEYSLTARADLALLASQLQTKKCGRQLLEELKLAAVGGC